LFAPAPDLIKLLVSSSSLNIESYCKEVCEECWLNGKTTVEKPRVIFNLFRNSIRELVRTLIGHGYMIEPPDERLKEADKGILLIYKM